MRRHRMRRLTADLKSLIPNTLLTNTVKSITAVPISPGVKEEILKKKVSATTPCADLEEMAALMVAIPIPLLVAVNTLVRKK